MSCVKSDRVYDGAQNAIEFDPVMSAMAKSIVTGTQYPATVPFGVYASYSSNPAGEWTSGSTQSYFENTEFVYKSDNKYGGSPSVYWPLSGSLVFAGYSPYYPDSGSVSATFDVATKTLSISNFVSDGRTDLMYFLPTLSPSGNYVGVLDKKNAVPVQFRHALSLISFEVKAKVGDEENILLKEIQIIDAKTKGNLIVSADAPDAGVWSSLSTPATFDLFESDGEKISAGSPIIVNRLMIPGDAASIRVVYDIDKYPNDSNDALVPQTKVFSPQELSLTEWEIGKKYTYILTIGARKIEASPIVSWL